MHVMGEWNIDRRLNGRIDVLLGVVEEHSEYLSFRHLIALKRSGFSRGSISEGNAYSFLIKITKPITYS